MNLEVNSKINLPSYISVLIYYNFDGQLINFNKVNYHSADTATGISNFYNLCFITLTCEIPPPHRSELHTKKETIL